MADQLRVVIRGLPFEAEKEQIMRFFGVAEEDLTVLTWPDSGRCKGVAFVDCSSQQEKQRLEAFEGREFEAKGNSRMISIRDYEEREPRRNQGGRRKRGGNQGGRRNEGGMRQQRSNDSREDRDDVFQKDDETGREVYVSNVSFDATADNFYHHFGQCGEIEDVTIPTLYTSGRPKGFAFVRFMTVEGRNNALQLDGSQMVNRNIGVRANRGRVQRERRERRERSTGLSEKPPGCNTIFVGNLPWSTDDAKLKELFENRGCGTVVSARVVRQSWTDRSRGFGYVEFETEAHIDTAVQMQLTIEDRELRLDYAENRSQ